MDYRTSIQLHCSLPYVRYVRQFISKGIKLGIKVQKMNSLLMLKLTRSILTLEYHIF